MYLAEIINQTRVACRMSRVHSKCEGATSPWRRTREEHVVVSDVTSRAAASCRFGRCQRLCRALLIVTTTPADKTSH